MLHLALRERGSYKTLAELVAVAPKRLSGSPGAAAAVEWGRQAMEGLGLDAIRLEPCIVPRWVRGDTCEVWAIAPTERVLLASTALGGSIATPPDGIEAPVMEVTTFGQLRSLGERARGAIVLFNRPFDLTLRNTFTAYSRAAPQRSVGAVEAAKAGGVAALVRSLTSMPDDHPHTGAMNYEDGVTRVPAAALSVVAADRLHDLIERHGDALRVRVVMNCENLDPVPSANVVGEIRGREFPDEIVLIGAHLDAWDLAEGAQDDGAGIAQCLEAARLILATGERPRRTIRVVLYMNEENGLAGGRAYAETHKDSLHRHVVAIETDSGSGPPRGFGVSGGREMIEALAPVAALLGRYQLGGIEPGGGGADISTLAPAGVPLMGLRPAEDRYFDVHHSARDTLDQVHPREISLGAAALAICALTIADMDTPLPRVPQGR
jgi:Zn-dependent M28 family amino/carboxypeptidase